MNKIAVILLLLLNVGFGQTSAPLRYLGQKLYVDIKGNKNTVKVIQGNVVKVYNMSNDAQAQNISKKH